MQAVRTAAEPASVSRMPVRATRDGVGCAACGGTAPVIDAASISLHVHVPVPCFSVKLSEKAQSVKTEKKGLLESGRNTMLASVQKFKADTLAQA
eukprot:2667697-Prymnesium_polylepis.1